MAAIVRRRFRPPVLGRLAWAWLALACACAGLGFYLIFGGERGATRIALPLAGEVERLARPIETRSVMAGDASAPALRDDAAAATFRPETDDVFAGAADRLEQPALAGAGDEPEGVIVITIDGGRRTATGVQPASLTPPPSILRIPDADPALLMKTPLGQRPKIAADGRRAARVYARPFDNPDGAPIVALVVAGLGLNAELTERAINELPPEVTLAFAPYARDLDYWTKRARDAGHEIVLELPMEAHGGDPAMLGPAALLAERASADNIQRLDWLLSRFGGYFAVTNYLGGKFSTDRAAMDPVLAHLAAAGVAYIDDTGAARRNPAGPLAVVNRMIVAGADGTDARSARRDLGALAQIAQRGGEALGKTYAQPAALDALVEFVDELAEHGLLLAPASAVIEKRAAS